MTKPSPTTPLQPGWAQLLSEIEASEIRVGDPSEGFKLNLSKSKTPSTVAVALDLTTGAFSDHTSGTQLEPRPVLPHPDMELPIESGEEWPVNNCAEYKGADKLQWSGSKMSNLEIHTTDVKTGLAVERCSNCKVTTNGALVTSDPPRSR